MRKAALSLDPREGVQALFSAIITQSTNAALILAYQRVIDRLKTVLTIEREQETTDGALVKPMVEVIAEGRIPDLLALLEAHHEHRCARAPFLARAAA